MSGLRVPGEYSSGRASVARRMVNSFVVSRSSSVSLKKAVPSRRPTTKPEKLNEIPPPVKKTSRLARAASNLLMSDVGSTGDGFMFLTSVKKQGLAFAVGEARAFGFDYGPALEALLFALGL